MPFPFGILAPIGAWLAGAAGAASVAAGTVAAGAVTAAGVAAAAAPFVAAGAAVLGGVAFTAFTIEQNKEARRKAREEAEKRASREREKELLRKKAEFEEKVSKLEKQYGSKVPQDKQEEILMTSSVLLGEFEGNKAGLEAKGQSSSPEADAVEAELKALWEQCGLKK